MLVWEWSVLGVGIRCGGSVLGMGVECIRCGVDGGVD